MLVKWETIGEGKLNEHSIWKEIESKAAEYSDIIQAAIVKEELHSIFFVKDNAGALAEKKNPAGKGGLLAKITSNKKEVLDGRRVQAIGIGMKKLHLLPSKIVWALREMNVVSRDVAL